MPDKITHIDALWRTFPIDGDGRPTTYLSYLILERLFSRPQKAYTSRELAEALATDMDYVEVTLRQLLVADIVIEDSEKPHSYRYHLRTPNVDVQAGLEKFLLEVELDRLPVHLMTAQ
jgi:hypothetical protein